MKNIIKKIVIVLLGLLLLSVGGFVVWAETPLGPQPEALAALKSDGQVKVTNTNYIAFEPVNVVPQTGFIFYPGGRVDYRSYAVPLHAIAARGYLVVLLPVRLNLAFFDIEAGADVFDAYPDIKNWVAGGHSLGGVASSLFAQSHADRLTGLVFWASYPADESLKNTGLKILSIYGTRDMAGAQAFEEKKPLLPDSVEYVVIEGGNHAQFGNYGLQPGDNTADISSEEQQKQVVEATASFLKTIGK